MQGRPPIAVTSETTPPIVLGPSTSFDFHHGASRLGEIRARVIAHLRRRRAPDLPIVAEVAALVHELGEILGEPMRPIHAETVAVRVQRHKYRREVALVHPAFCGSANLLSGDGAHRYLLIVMLSFA